MFSTKFNVVEKYDLNSKEYLETYENIFYEFSPICDVRYEPKLPPDLVEKFSKVFDYRFNNNAVPFNLDESFFGVSYLGKDILSYDIQTNIDYNFLRSQKLWEHFLMAADINQISHLKAVMDLKTSETDPMTNKISNFTFNKFGNITGIALYDTKYKQTKQNSYLDFINSFSNTNEKYNNFVYFNSNGTFKSELMYFLPILKGKYRISPETKNLINLSKLDYETYHQSIFEDMKENNILDDDDIDYIKSHLSGERVFSLEFDLDKNEQLVKRTLCIVTHDLFQEL